MRILGIDVGTSSIKAVELNSAFGGRFDIHDYYENKVEPGADLVLALSRLMNSLPKQPDRIAIALKTGQVTFRNLKLPTRDRKSIQASVGFELDDDLPFPLENAAYDYTVLTQTKQGTSLHVAATLKSHLAGTIGAWNTAGIDPDLVTTESWAYRTLLNKILSPEQQAEPVVLVHIGHEHTTLHVHLNGAPVMAREATWGGRDFTDAIAKKYSLPPAQAEQAKIDHGFIVPHGSVSDVTPEQAEFSETLLATLQSLIVELRQVELTCKSITHKPVTQIFLAGGTSLLPGLPRVIEDSLRIPTRTLQSLSAIATSGVTYSEHTDASFVLAAAVALCMVGPERSMAVNLRKGEFGKQGSQREFSIDSLKRPIMAMGAALGCLTLSLTVQTASYNSKLKDLNSQLEKSMKSFFGPVSQSQVSNYLYNPTLLKKSLDKELNKQRDIAKLAAPNPHSPLDFLSTISVAIPKSVVTDMMEYRVGAAPGPYKPQEAQSASLTFVVPNAKVADDLNTALTGKLVGLKREKGETVTAPDGSKQLKVTFTGQPAFAQ